MKKYARVFSMLALILAITFIFSGCGVIDFAKSILIKEEATTTPGTTISGDIVYTDDATNSALITPPSDTLSDTQATTGTTTTAGTTSTATTEASTEASTQATDKKPTTTAPVLRHIFPNGGGECACPEAEDSCDNAPGTPPVPAGRWELLTDIGSPLP